MLCDRLTFTACIWIRALFTSSRLIISLTASSALQDGAHGVMSAPNDG